MGDPHLASLALRVFGVVALAVLLHLGLRRAGQRLPLLLTRRVLGAGATHPDAGLRRLVGFVLGPAGVALWAGVAWWVSEHVTALRAARGAAAALLRMALGTPLFTMNERGYTAFDLLVLPLLLAAVWVGVGGVTRLVEARVLGAEGREHGASEAVGMLVRYVATLVGGLVVLQAWGVDVRTLAIAGSVLGVGIGFGLQNLANNFVSGIVISLERPVKPGDYVRVGEFQGTVERVGARSTEILTRDRVSILVPNARFLEQEVVNWTHGDPACRLSVPVGVSYGTDLRLVRTALLEAAAGHPDVLRQPPARVELRRFGESALDVELEVFTREPRRQSDLVSDLNFRIEAAFRRHGIAIPFPQRDLHLRAPELAVLLEALARRHLGAGELAAAHAALAAQVVAPPNGGGVALGGGERVWDDAALDALVARLRDRGGLEVRDRRHALTVYPRCFVGREAVDWLCAHEELSRSEAVRLGQRLLERGVLHHVLDEHDFRDGRYYYRFRADET